MSSFLLQAVGGGVAFSFGVFFVEFLLTFDEGKGITAWIGSINTGLLFGAGKRIMYFFQLDSSLKEEERIGEDGSVLRQL